MNRTLVGVLALATLLSASLYVKVGARHTARATPRPDRRDPTPVPGDSIDAASAPAARATSSSAAPADAPPAA